MASSDDLAADLEAISPQGTQQASGNSLEDDLNAISPSSTQAQPTSALDEAKHLGGLTARGLMTGVSSLPATIGDLPIHLYNDFIAKKFGWPQQLTFSEGTQQAANAMGLPKPQSLGETALTAGASMVGGLATPMPILSALKPNITQNLLNNSWSQAIGEDADKVTSDVLGDAAERMGKVFSSVRDQAPRTIDVPKVNNFLTGLDDEFKGLIGNGLTDVSDHPLVQKFMSLVTDPSGSATGQQLGKISSQLGKAATKQFTSPTGDADLGFALSQVKEAADDIVQQGLSPEESATYGAARSQYRAMMQLLRSRALNVDTGDVNPNTMGGFLQNTDRSGYAQSGNQSAHYAMTHAMRAAKPPPTSLTNLSPGGIPLGPWTYGAYQKGALPPIVKAGAGLYQGLKEEDETD